MHSVFKRWQEAAALTLVITLAGCAQLSPQLLTFESTVGAEEVVNAPVTMTVAVVDDRAEQAIGYRGGIYSDTSVIESKQPLAEQIKKIASEAFRAGGAEITNVFPQFDVQISIDEFSYVSEDVKTGIKRSTGAARLGILVTSGQGTFRNSFKTSEYIETLGYPSEEKNEELLKNIFNSVMERMLSDPELELFLSEY
ncbi:YajG family lipoprotein [Reinekea marinisedimentorum]|uniref:Putative lipoprotein YajG n=1 Tax=Reinekea marinisedimentorum TaxID=230495 RepID=A0A4R3IAB3_9GAMM|nr:YajG family lipoprotein [Reinekea marinisedimentorum]TCS42437.1 putative lipoprotein YajG [Reinekea marinisedimentorum]